MDPRPEGGPRAKKGLVIATALSIIGKELGIQPCPSSIDSKIEKEMCTDIPVRNPSTTLQLDQVGHDVPTILKKGNLGTDSTSHFQPAKGLFWI